MRIDLRTYFLIDGIGALVSALLLGIVLVKFQSLIGIPKETLYLLASIPILFMIYDLVHFLGSFRKPVHLRIIALANVLYCVLSTVLVSYHLDRITTIGLIYFVGEILVVLILSKWELKGTNGL